MTSISPTLGILRRNPSWHVRFAHQNDTLLLFWHWSTLIIFCFHVLILYSLLFWNSRQSSDNSKKVFSASWTRHQKTFSLVMHFVFWHTVWVLLLLCWCITGFNHCNCFDLSMFTPHTHFGVGSLMTVYFSPRWLMFLLVLLLHFLFFTNICTCSTFIFFCNNISRHQQYSGKNFFSALLPSLGTVTALPAEGKAHAISSIFTVFSSSWPIVPAFITYDLL